MLPEWTQRLAVAGAHLDDALDALRRRLRRRSRGDSPLQIVPYRGFGNTRELHVLGRLLVEQPISSGEGTLLNLLATYRRFHSREVPQKEVTAQVGPHSITCITNNEGFFSATLPNPVGPSDKPWIEARYEAAGTTATGRVFVPPSTARFGVISDLDDTVVVSHATHLPKMLATLLFENARTRIPFPGVGAFYRALAGEALNPFFYVSSGPWNLYDLMVDFLELNNLPAGPLFLQDYGLERDRFITTTHHRHKTEQIERILNLDDRLPYILIGDSGQRDPEIYSSILRRFPTRVLAVYIRDVTAPARDAEVQKLCGTDMLLVQSSLEAARHAVSRGLIPESALASIQEDRETDLQTAAAHR